MLLVWTRRTAFKLELLVLSRDLDAISCNREVARPAQTSVSKGMRARLLMVDELTIPTIFGIYTECKQFQFIRAWVQESSSASYYDCITTVARSSY